MEIINQEYGFVPVDALKPHPRNPHQSDDIAIAESIARNGFYGAVIAQQGTGYVLAGHGRLRAARVNGAVEVPVVWVEADDEQALRILLADNRVNELSTYDQAALTELLGSLESLEGTGYDQAALDELLTAHGVRGALDSGPDAKIDRAEELLSKWNVERGSVVVDSKQGHAWQISPPALWR